MRNLVVMAQIAGRRCAFGTHEVQSVIELGAITPVPAAPPHIAGITALRSKPLTVIDSRQALGFNSEDWELDNRAIVVAVQGFSYALKVDRIEDVTSEVTKPSEIPGGFGPQWTYVSSGMIETMTGPALLVDVPKIINPPVNIEDAA